MRVPTQAETGETPMAVVQHSSSTRANRRQEILNAARDAFLARGYAATTIDSIAAKVAISPALIYKHFDGKPALFASIVEEGLDRLRDALASATKDHHEGAPALRAIGKAYLQFYRERTDYFNVLNFYDHVHGQTPFPHPHKENIQEKVTACLRVVADVLEMGQRRGEFRILDTWETANVFWGAFNGILLLDAHGKTRLTQTELTPLLDHLLDMFERSVRAAP